MGLKLGLGLRVRPNPNPLFFFLLFLFPLKAFTGLGFGLKCQEPYLYSDPNGSVLFPARGGGGDWVPVRSATPGLFSLLLPG